MLSPSSVTAMYFPSGDQSAVWKNVGWSNLISRGALRPSCDPIIRRYSPLASENQPTCFPSGDHTGVPPSLLALRGGYREDSAADEKERARPARRQRRRRDPFRRVHPARLGPRQIAAARDGELGVLARRRLEQVEIARCFVDHDARAGVERLGVVVLVVCELRELLRRN